MEEQESSRLVAECVGQLSMVCESCHGERVIRSTDTPTEVCRDCDGTGLELDSIYSEVVVRSYYFRLRDLAAGVVEPRMEVPPAH